MDAAWGVHPIDLQAGEYRVRVCSRLLFDVGAATLSVTVEPGTVTTVYYRAPLVLFARGAIGLTPQRPPGRVALVAVLAFPLVLMLAWFLVLECS